MVVFAGSTCAAKMFFFLLSKSGRTLSLLYASKKVRLRLRIKFVYFNLLR